MSNKGLKIDINNNVKTSNVQNGISAIIEQSEDTLEPRLFKLSPDTQILVGNAGVAELKIFA